MEHGIPPTPKNYTIWYEYVSGNYAALNQAIDALIKHSERFTEEVNRDLYNNFLACDDEKEIEKIRAELQQLVNESNQHISGATNEAGRYQASLKGHAQRLTNGLDSKKILQIIDALGNETQEMVDTNTGLQTKLTAMSRELINLRQQLEMVHSELMIDALTGLINRKGFDSMLEQCANEASESRSNLCLLMIDVDFFKCINDKYGHIMGDEVLKFISAQMRTAIKGKDIASRFGGEEFAVILPNTPISGALHIAEELRKTIGSSRLKRKTDQQTLDKVTISIGVSWLRHNEGINDFIERADKALYQAKNSGRDKVVSGESS